ncbi:VOC family protein [Acidovorax temperans]|uniref:VOC family protein n=1 Tax=Acidovorax temperans TaxID=80878 RepID=UPI0030D58B3B
MPLALDHIVIAVADLDRAMADYRALGFQVLPGGQHPGRTSHNALVVFADGTYLELIAWRAPAPEERWYRTLSAHGEGLVDYALLPPDTAEALAQAQARGLHTLTGPLDGGRLRPDGAQLRWQTARHATPDVPFLCGDLTPRALRVPEGSVRQHPNGAQGVAEVTVAVHNLDATLARYRALLGAQADGAAATMEESIHSARIPLGGVTLVLQSPAPNATGESPAAQALRERLSTRGEGPCAFTLRSDQHALPTTPNLSATHGVALAWQH